MFKHLNRNQKMMLVVLASINFINYLDRQVIFPLFGYIKKDFDVNDFQLGLLGTAFLLVHSITSIPLGVLADRYSRRLVAAGGVFFWSIASFASGLAMNFKALVVTRSLVGVGEASYAPAATAMISDNFPKEVRGQAQGIFNVGLFAGGVFGGILGALIAFYTDSWRTPFFFVSLPGIVLAILALKLKDKVTHVKDELKANFWSLFRNSAFAWILISGTLISFAAGGYISWGVEFISRYKGYNIRDASLAIGSILLVAGVLGVLFGSWLADYFQKKSRYGSSLVIAISLIISAPFMYLMLIDSSFWFFIIVFFIGIFLSSFYHGPSTVVIHEVVPRNMRATAYASYLFVIHLLGDTISPAFVGRVSDMANLRLGLAICAGMILLGGLAFLPVSYLIHKGKVAQGN